MTRSQLASRRLLIMAAVVAAVGLVLTALVAAGGAHLVPVGVRAVIVVLAATVLPGVPAVVALAPASRVVGTALATSASWAVTILVAQATLVADAWHPLVATAVLDGASLILCGALLDRLPRPGRRGGARSPWSVAVAWVVRRRAPLVAIAVAVLFFAIAAATIDLRGLGPFGLITAVRWPYLVALVLVAAVWVVGLGSPRVDHGLLVLASAALTVFTTALVSLASGRSSVPTGFTHRTFIDLIVHEGHMPPPLDARFDWAGFFAGSAQLVEAGGLHDATPFMSPAPVVAGVLLIAPLFAIGRAITGSARLAWVGVLLYQLANWYQQDYFAPQMVAQLWYTTLAALLLWWWRAGRTARPSGSLRHRALIALSGAPARPPGVGARRALATEGLAALLCTAMVVTHQLTPIALIAALLAFSLTGSTRFRFLWVATAAVFTVWFSYGAQDYWVGNLGSLYGDLGQVQGSVSGGVGARIGTLPSREIGQGLRIAASGALGALALLGWCWRRRRPGWLLAGALSGIPFGLVAVQSYGGEVVIRCFLLASPFLAPLAAEFLVRALPPLRVAWRRRLPPLTAVVLTCAILAGGVLVTLTRGLNDSFEQTTATQDEIGQRLTDAVPSGTTIAPLGTAPWLENHRWPSEVTFGFTQQGGSTCSTVVVCVEKSRPDYVVITPEMQSQLRYMDGAAANVLDAAQRRLTRRDGYVVAYRSPDLTILRRSDVTVPAGAL